MSSVADARRQVGKLITGRVYGKCLDDDVRRLIVDGTISGVTLFKDNVASLKQLAELIEEIRQAGGDEFLVAVDQEGGAVQRLDEVISPLPSAMALASFGTRQKIDELMRLAARQLKLLGINCNLVPVLDINSNRLNPIIGTRSFGSDPNLVAEMGLLVARAHAAEGVIPVGKHFPGHGDTSTDSHLGMAVVDADAEILRNREFLPFRILAKQLPAMLTSHVWLKAYDANMVPSSLSSNVTGKLLRKELGFDGYVLTDDLPVMKAVVDYYGLADASVKAIVAGNDNLLVSGTVEQMRSVNDALCGACERGDIAAGVLQKSLARRSALFAAYQTAPLAPLSDRLSKLPDLVQLGTRLSSEISAAAIKQFRGASPALRSGSEWTLVVPQLQRYSLDLLKHLSEQLQGADISLHERRYSPDPSAEEIEEVAAFARGKNVLYLTFRAVLNRGQLLLGRRIAACAQEAVIIATDVPYDADELPDFVHAIGTFDPSDLAIRALSQKLVQHGFVRGKYE